MDSGRLRDSGKRARCTLNQSRPATHAPNRTANESPAGYTVTQARHGAPHAVQVKHPEHLCLSQPPPSLTAGPRPACQAAPLRSPRGRAFARHGGAEPRWNAHHYIAHTLPLTSPKVKARMQRGECVHGAPGRQAGREGRQRRRVVQEQHGRRLHARAGARLAGAPRSIWNSDSVAVLLWADGRGASGEAGRGCRRLRRRQAACVTRLGSAAACAASPPARPPTRGRRRYACMKVDAQTGHEMTRLRHSLAACAQAPCARGARSRLQQQRHRHEPRSLEDWCAPATTTRVRGRQSGTAHMAHRTPGQQGPVCGVCSQAPRRLQQGAHR